MYLLAKGWLGAFCSSVHTVTQAHYTAKSQLKEDLLKEEDDGSFPRVAPALIGGRGQGEWDNFGFEMEVRFSVFCFYSI